MSKWEYDKPELPKRASPPLLEEIIRHNKNVSILDNKEIIDRCAKALFNFEEKDKVGVIPNYETRVWRIPELPWDSCPEKELCEWERDEYRTLAKTVLRAYLGEPEWDPWV